MGGSVVDGGLEERVREPAANPWQYTSITLRPPTGDGGGEKPLRSGLP